MTLNMSKGNLFLISKNFKIVKGVSTFCFTKVAEKSEEHFKLKYGSTKKLYEESTTKLLNKNTVPYSKKAALSARITLVCYHS